MDNHTLAAVIALSKKYAGEITSNISAEIAQNVTDWLDEHVDPETGYVIDDTLTIQGAAADAKKTGDELTDLKNQIFQHQTSIEDILLTKVLTDAQKNAILACFRNVTWIDDQGQTYYEALQDAFNVSITSISAVYTQSGTVYDTQTLDDLRQNLVVTVTLSDGTTSAVKGYTLSGSLTVGTSTIFVSYQGYETSFTVVVTGAFIYRLPNTPLALDGSFGIDSGVALLSENRSFTLALEFVDRRNYTLDTTNNYPFTCYVPSSPYTGIFLQVYDGGVGSASNRRIIRHILRCTPPGASGGGQIIFDNDIAEEDVVGRIIRFCFRYDSTTGTVKALLTVNKGTITQTSDSVLYTYTAIDNTLMIGGRKGVESPSNFMLGVFNDFKVFNSTLSDAEMQEYVEGIV